MAATPTNVEIAAIVASVNANCPEFTPLGNTLLTTRATDFLNNLESDLVVYNKAQEQISDHAAVVKKVISH